MTSRANVTIAALEGVESRAAEIARGLSACAAEGESLEVAVASLGDLEGDSLAKIDLLLLISPTNVTQSMMLALLNQLDDGGVPVLALLDAPPKPGNCFEYGGAMAMGWDVEPRRLCGIIHGILYRQKEVRRLRAEAALNQRFHGGLKGEIAKMHEELQLAAIVQREFLPRETPALHGVDFAALWRPTNYVSGDIYDLIRLDEDHVGVFIADAVGHGVPAALMTMVICRSLATKEITGNSYIIVPPSEVLARLNTEMIRRQGRTTRFATAAYAVIDCRRRMMTLAGAGHPPPVLIAADGTSRVLDTPGGLLGVFGEERYDQIDVELKVDDRVLFYTDGFEQAFPAAETDQYDRRIPSTRYRGEFDRLGSLPTSSEMVEAISTRLDDQAGSLHQIDDLTLICLHVGALAQAAPDPAAPATDQPARPEMNQPDSWRLAS